MVCSPRLLSQRMRIIQPRIGGLFASLAASSRFASTVNMKELPYGSWPSPITAKFITSSSVRLGSLSVDKEGELYWLEGRPQEKGRQVVVRYCGEAAKSDRAAAVPDDVARESCDARARDRSAR